MDAIKDVIKKSSDPELIESAFLFAQKSYEGKQRISGENYIDHTSRVASTLSEMGLDTTTIIVGLLHDIIDDVPNSAKKIQLREVEKNYGREVAVLIEKVSNLGKVRYPFINESKEKTKFTKEKFENLQKVFFAIAGDIRVILVELVSRLDNLEHLRNLTIEQQKIYALETLKIFVPIASKLNIWELKYRLEDLAFLYFLPEKAQWVRSEVKEKFNERKSYLKSFSIHLKKLLKKNGVNVINIDFRPKSYWSIYKKLQKYNNNIEKVHDLLALRIIVSTIESCYKTLGVIHKRWTPISDEINDYIAKPKPNGYRSLHTTISSETGHITEIQIRTPDMHREAEYGICAHWAYKEKVDLSKDKENLEISKEVPEAWEKLKINFYENRVFVFTPRGDVIVLPKGSTPIDFAYAVHSEIGNHCETAKVNRKIVNFSYLLENGDIVEIIVNKKNKPSMDWLKFVKTSLAVSQIKKELAKSSLMSKVTSLSQIPYYVKRKVFEISERIARKQGQKKPLLTEKQKGPRSIYLAGQKGIMVTKAKCCSPLPDDEVVAYISKYRAAVLHKPSCKEFQKLAKKFPEKVMEAHWE
ncbi:MAG: HD domain-containing protein [Candidatus Staskawiczbacteria bacterium]|jgi:RelA/SpoT family (p)ppGpp synthetase